MGDDVCLFNQDTKIHWTLADMFVVNCNAPLVGLKDTLTLFLFPVNWISGLKVMKGFLNFILGKVIKPVDDKPGHEVLDLYIILPYQPIK